MSFGHAAKMASASSIVLWRLRHNTGKMRRGIARLADRIAEHVQAKVSGDVLQFKEPVDEPAVPRAWERPGVSELPERAVVDLHEHDVRGRRGVAHVEAGCERRTLECTEARKEGKSPSRYTTMKNFQTHPERLEKKKYNESPSVR